MSPTSRSRCLVLFGLLLVLTTVSPGIVIHRARAQEQTRWYSVSPLVTSAGVLRSAVALDEGGFPAIVGNGLGTDGQPAAYLGNAHALRPLPTLGGGWTEARALSYGRVAGAALTREGATHAFTASYGTTATDLGTLGGADSVANGMAGDFVVGTASIAGDVARRPFILDLRTGVMTEVPITSSGTNASATAVNLAGHVVGVADPVSGTRTIAYLFAGGVTRDLGTLGGSSEARAVNESDVVVGRSQVADGAEWHAFVHADGVMRDLGTLGGAASDALDVDPSGRVVGWAENEHGDRRAVLWENGEPLDLNRAIAESSGWVLEAATGINDQGAIVGYGQVNGEARGFLLTPPMDVRLDLRIHSNDLDTNHPNPHTAGERLTFGTTLWSDGPFTVSGVTVVTVISGPVEIVSRSGLAECDQQGLTLTCQVAPFDFWRDLFVTVRATGPGVITHEAFVTPEYRDPNPSNNAGSESNRAVSLASLALAGASVTGGSPVLARATLTSPTPGGGARVTLTSSNPAVAAVPNPFDVLPGCCDGGLWREFYVWTTPVSAPTTVEISASYGLITQTVPLIVVPTGGASPYDGVTAVIPGTIEAERFDEGAEGAAYHDLSSTNEGGVFRDTGVDLATAEDADGGYTVGWIGAGEWLSYAIDVRTAGIYTLAARLASAGPGGTFHLEVNGADVSGPITVPDTGGWQSWATVVHRGVGLTAGSQVLRIVMDAVGPSTAVGNINWLRFDLQAASAPFGDVAAAVPGVVEAEHFDEGGEGVAWHDLGPGNEGGAYRDTDVDLASAEDEGEGFTVGWIGAGEWLAYTVDVAAEGRYTLEARVASAGPGGTFHIEIDGVDRSGPMAVPDTGGWQQWSTIVRDDIHLPAGRQVLRVVMDTAGASFAVGNLNWMRFTAAPR